MLAPIHGLVCKISWSCDSLAVLKIYVLSLRRISYHARLVDPGLKFRAQSFLLHQFNFHVVLCITVLYVEAIRIRLIPSFFCRKCTLQACQIWVLFVEVQHRASVSSLIWLEQRATVLTHLLPADLSLTPIFPI